MNFHYFFFIFHALGVKYYLAFSIDLLISRQILAMSVFQKCFFKSLNLKGSLCYLVFDAG